MYDVGELNIAKLPAIPLSESRFSWTGEHLEFVRDAEGKISHLVFETPEGPAKAFRKSAPK